MHSIQVAITKENDQLTSELKKQNFLFRNVNGWTIIAKKRGIRPVISRFNDFCALVMTNYFGGFGEQGARFINLKTKEEKQFKQINQALELLGVQKDEDFKSDLYDYIELCKIRKNIELKRYC